MSTQPGQQTDFGANEWLVYEIHQQYLKDPDSVSEAWREFLSDYRPGDGAAGGTTAEPAAAPAPATSNGGAAETSPAPPAPPA
ncbi:MAG: Dihydrolipoamide succinyltransferase component (E2) of 2-oxoglutarate dehydrogenase complex / 2-oxoglutarate dehydrogenase E1 component @ 2-oxoglutarate decarboxylase @ 2-hydroxy-3-oxoadipate synthase, partial [uncultured Frankineae bacterium]